jgi:hypothetical protein
MDIAPDFQSASTRRESYDSAYHEGIQHEAANKRYKGRWANAESDFLDAEAFEAQHTHAAERTVNQDGRSECEHELRGVEHLPLQLAFACNLRDCLYNCDGG